MGANNPAKTDPITDANLQRLFAGFGEDAPRTSGGENEIFFGIGKTLELPDDDLHLDFTSRWRTSTADISYSDEPGTHMVEIKNNGAYLKSDLIESPRDIFRQKAIVTARMDQFGLKHSPFSCMPFSTKEACLDSIIGPRGEGSDYSDRPRTLMHAFKMHLPPEAVSYPVINDCVHWTTNVRSPQEAFEMSRLQVAMMPFWFIYTENRPPYQDNSEERVTDHTGLRSRMSLGNRGTYPDFLFAAKDHREYVDRMIDRITKTSMLAYFDYDGQIQPVPKELQLKPSDMQGYGPENISQFEMAMSQFWYNYKLKGITGGEGTLFERRDFDEAPETFQDVMLVCSMIDYDDTARVRLVKALERDYGIPLFSDAQIAHGIIRDNIVHALRRGTDGARFVDTPFGATSKNKTVHDFLTDTILPMMEEFHKHTGMSGMLNSWRYKSERKTTNAQFWYDNFSSMAQQRGFVAELLQEPNYHDYFISGQNWAEQLEDVVSQTTSSLQAEK